MKRDWTDAPERANWLATDGNGVRVWFEEKPEPHATGPWWNRENVDYYEVAFESDVHAYEVKFPNWKESLEQRPIAPAPVAAETHLDASDLSSPEVTDHTFGCRDKFTGPCNFGGGVIAEEFPEAAKVLRPGEHIIKCAEDNGEMEVTEGAVMNTPGYERLAGVLVRAFDQAASGKGKERHANDLPFDEQPMQSISDLIGTEAGMAFQAIKKIQESGRLPTREAKVRELLGAIVYVSGMVIWLEDNAVDVEWSDQPIQDPEDMEPWSVDPEKEWSSGYKVDFARNEFDDDVVYYTCLETGVSLPPEEARLKISAKKEKRAREAMQKLGFVKSPEEQIMVHSSGVKAVFKGDDVHYEYPDSQQ
jgi:hypothetical protein